MANASAPIRQEDRGEGVTVVTVLDPSAVSSPQALYAVVDGLAARPGAKKLVVNLGQVKAINSAGIGVLINVQKRVRNAGGALKLCAIHPFVLQIMQITKLDQIMDLHATEDEALDAFRRGKVGPGSGSGAGSGGPGGGSWFSRLFGGGSR